MPKAPTPKKDIGSAKKLKQQSLLSFFTKSPNGEHKKKTDDTASKTESGKNSDSDKENEGDRAIKSTIDDDYTVSESPNTSVMDDPSRISTLPSSHEKVKNIPKTPSTEIRNLKLSSSAMKVSSSPLASRRVSKKNVSYAESDEDEDDIVPKSQRKRRKFVPSDDEEEYHEDDTNIADDNDDSLDEFIVEDDVDEDFEDEDDIDIKPKKSKSKAKSKSFSAELNSSPIKNRPGDDSSLTERFNRSSNSSFKPKISTAVPSKPSFKSTGNPKKNFDKENEERYKWLIDVKDAEGRGVDDPDYDSRTLYIPKSAWSKFTAFETQYWEIKSKMWDTVVFFKKGKFYELYENDAQIAHSEFDLKIAGGGRANMKLAGIPEMSFGYWAKEFINHGYKVAKVDQKESLLAKEIRETASLKKEDKVIKRELSCVLTGGTLTDLGMITDDMAIYCLSVKEEQLNDGSKVFGITFVDTATSEINFIEFNDDAECTKLDTIITQIRPKEIICEKGNLCSFAAKIIKFNSSLNSIWNYLNPSSEFWDYDKTFETLVREKYYEAQDLDDLSHYPAGLLDLKDSHKLAFNAFGGLLYYLKFLKLDSTIMTLGNIRKYDMVKNSSTLILDGITLSNLEILGNSFDGSDKGTLFRLLNRAITPFGKRKLKNWVLHPLLDISEINARYDSVEYLMNNGEFRSCIEDGLVRLPDLERLLARIHSKTLKFKEFLKVIQAYEKITELFSMLKSFNDVTGCLNNFIYDIPEQLTDCIKEWEDAFDRVEALSDIIIPEKGVDEKFDDSNQLMQELETQLENYLREYRKEYKSQEIVFRDSGKEIFLIEVPVKIKSIPKSWQQMGATSKVKRFYSPEVKVIVRKLMEQRELHKSICETLKSRMYEKFDNHYDIWLSTIDTIANIDCIVALTRSSETIGYPSCRPNLVDSENGKLEFKSLRNPCFSGLKDFIPNDVLLGGDQPKIGLLTGANAAGKSTIMRTTALAVILSQVGCYVPAELAQLTPIDRIMTRLGANDNIMQGKSTFLVELSETKKILENSTPKSLVILDELGRGGSSSDGYAIAESVLYHLATHVQSLGFFATHYGTLGLSFKTHPQVKPLRMAIMIDESSRNITFLYKLEEGTAPGSFGMNVAAMCGIDASIVDRAEIAAKDYEHTSKLKRVNEKLFNGNGGVNLTLGLQSDTKWLAKCYGSLNNEIFVYNEAVKKNALRSIFGMIDNL